jgi:hypothetical protein
MTTFRSSDVNLGHLGADLNALRCKKTASGGHLPLKIFANLGTLNLSYDIICPREGVI